MKELTIPHEVADKITLACLQEHLEYLRADIREHTESDTWMHPEDYHMNMTKLIPALEILIKYYGG